MTIHSVRPILERIAYFVYLAVLACSIGLAWLGGIGAVLTGNFGPLLISFGGLALSVWLHFVGHAHWHFQQCEESLTLTGHSGLWEEEQIRLLSEFALLLEKFQTEDDVWERGEIRRQLSQRLAATPGLREEFAAELARYPEL